MEDTTLAKENGSKKNTSQRRALHLKKSCTAAYAQGCSIQGWCHNNKVLRLAQVRPFFFGRLYRVNGLLSRIHNGNRGIFFLLAGPYCTVDKLIARRGIVERRFLLEIHLQPQLRGDISNTQHGSCNYWSGASCRGPQALWRTPILNTLLIDYTSTVHHEYNLSYDYGGRGTEVRRY